MVTYELGERILLGDGDEALHSLEDGGGLSHLGRHGQSLETQLSHGLVHGHGVFHSHGLELGQRLVDDHSLNLGHCVVHVGCHGQGLKLGHGPVIFRRNGDGSVHIVGFGYGVVDFIRLGQGMIDINRLGRIFD